jgi:hypothetical protein
MLDQLMGRKPNAAHVRQEIHDYVQTLMTGLKPHPKTEEKNELEKE